MADNEKELNQEASASENAAAPAKEEAPKKEKSSRKMSAAVRKKFKYGGLAAAITAVVVAIVVVVNILVSTLVEKYPLKLDLTETAMYEISEDTIDYVSSLEQDVNFTVLMDESNFKTSGTYLKMVHEILQKYTQHSDRINLTYVDPTTNPDVVNQYQEHYSGTLTTGDVVIASAEDPSKMRVVNVDKMFTYDDEKYYYYMYYGYYTLEDCITAFTGEQDLTAALMYVTDANPVRVGVISMANSKPIFNVQSCAYSVAIFMQNLTKNGYDVTEIDLYTNALDPAEFDMLVLPAPVNDLTEDAVEKISDFLYNDGAYEHDLIYFADRTQSSTPRLDALLETWGLQVGKTIVTEGEQANAQIVSVISGGQAVQVGAPTAVIVDQDYSANMANTSLPIPAPFCRPITCLWESQTNGITSELLRTSDTVYLSELGSAEESDTTPDGAQVIAAVSRRQTSDTNNKILRSNIMVFGSMMLSDYYIMQDAAYNNAEYLMSAVNTMTGKGGGLIIAQKDLSKSTITIDQGQLNAVNVAIYAIPFIVVVIGIVVFVRRRNK
ncbi:MAG: GldG family protein [Oscillospiraceae bacterium]|nr:GldG family protein [Oscillospiraceae bacterium]